jgi:hypothetical protein
MKFTRIKIAPIFLDNSDTYLVDPRPSPDLVSVDIAQVTFRSSLRNARGQGFRL